MSKDTDIIKKCARLFADAERSPEIRAKLATDTDAFLAKKGLSPQSIRDAASKIGGEIPVSDENCEDLLEVAHFVRQTLMDFPLAIQIYLEIVKQSAYRSDVYRILYDIYFYDFETVWNFDFLSLVMKAFDPPLPGIDPLFYCMSYTYIGRLYERLGKLFEARQAYIIANTWVDDPRKITGVAEYGNLELDFIVSACHTDLAPLFSAPSENKKGGTGKPKLVVGSVFFGSEYVHLFKKSAGETFFCDSNLKQLKKHWRPVLVVFCPTLDRLNFENSELYKLLKPEIGIHIVTIPRQLISNYPDKPPPGHIFHPAQIYALSGLGQVCIAEIARRHDADLISLPPDAVFSNRTVAGIVAAAGAGKTVLFTPGIRLAREAVLAELPDRSEDADTVAMGLSPDALTALALDNLHPATEATFANNDMVTHPGMLWWQTGEDGLVGHCFQMHPIFVARSLLRAAQFRRFDSIDGDFVYSLIPDRKDWNDIGIVMSEGQAPMFELSPPTVPHALEYETRGLPTNAKRWLLGVMRPLNFWLFKKQVRIGATAAGWTDEYEEQEKKILAGLDDLSSDLPFTHPTNTAAVVAEQKSQFESLIGEWNSRQKEKPALVRPNVKRVYKGEKDLRVFYSLAIWGREYIENFLSICLPSMLADGNIGDLANNANSKFQIHTREEDVHLFEVSPEYRYLTTLIDVEIVHIDTTISTNKYIVLGSAQSNSVQSCRDYDVIFFLYSDFVWAKGSMRNTLRRIAEGYDGVVSPVPPLVLEGFQDILETDSASVIGVRSFGYVIELSPRELVRRGKPILHPMMRDNTIDYEIHTGNPAYVLWLGPHDDLLIRCFHAHPVALRVQHNNPKFWEPFHETLDEVFLPQVYPSLDKLYFVRDTDEIAIVSLTEASFPIFRMPEDHFLDALFIARWAEACATPMHKYMFNHYTLWHAHDIDEDAWRPTLERSERTASEVRFMLSLPDLALRHEHPVFFGVRDDRARRMRQKEKMERLDARKAAMQRNIFYRAVYAFMSLFGYLGFRVLKLIFGRLRDRTKRKILAALPQRLVTWIDLHQGRYRTTAPGKRHYFRLPALFAGYLVVRIFTLFFGWFPGGIKRSLLGLLPRGPLAWLKRGHADYVSTVPSLRRRFH